MTELEDATDEYGNRRAGVTEQKFRELKVEVQKLLEEEEKATIFRARTKYYEEGEKCTAYFFNQIKANRKASNINSLKKEDGTVLKGNEVGKEIYNFYEKLYQNDDCEKREYDITKKKFLGKNIEKKNKYGICPRIRQGAHEGRTEKCLIYKHETRESPG